MVLAGHVKSLTMSGIYMLVVFANLNVKVGTPAQLSVYVTFLREFGVIRHARTLHFILFVGVQRALRIQHYLVTILELFAEILLHTEKENG